MGIKGSTHGEVKEKTPAANAATREMSAIIVTSVSHAAGALVRLSGALPDIGTISVGETLHTSKGHAPNWISERGNKGKLCPMNGDQRAGKVRTLRVLSLTVPSASSSGASTVPFARPLPHSSWNKSQENAMIPSIPIGRIGEPDW